MATQYRVWLEVRERGALGVFHAMPFDVTAHATSVTATEIAVDEAHTLGLETRFPLRVVQRASYMERTP